MKSIITPITKQNLPDNLAQKIIEHISIKKYKIGDKLPSQMKLAELFSVGVPTVREAIKRLETVGAVVVKHGSGIFIEKYYNCLFIPNPMRINGNPTKKMLLDIVESRLSLEIEAINLVFDKKNKKFIAELKNILKDSKKHLNDNDKLIDLNKLFHWEIALASGNTVLFELIRVLTSLFNSEQRILIEKYISNKKDFEEHSEIYEAFRENNKNKVIKLMKSHLHKLFDIIKN
jgi:GntR family transcriptional repressor for pyruvate dehydrogenase complex